MLFYPLWYYLAGAPVEEMWNLSLKPYRITNNIIKGPASRASGGPIITSKLLTH
jgi:hypothetical protein